ncbi:Mannan endo-1,4-beta-mannosidase A and B precursor [Lacunisphaera limnophila]|uniref:Mannan endo-1,4-beta-mannosidase A and B n=1 Tax=Lacunisphaera limnophila TaxID=1838286 RepID=A0A1I7PHY9_9BACT|nr:Mannan endo-1,4-beta-mannosidase A and B precursor [Lacunisphaera limnophila]
MLLVLALAFTAARAADPTAPADPDLNPRGRAILSWFQQLSAGSELRLVSGQFAGWSGSASIGELGRIHAATGRWPVMIGLDYCGWDKGEALLDVRQPNQLATAYWQAGGLVNLSWHAPNPSKPNGGGLKERGMDLATVLTPGATHDRWMKYLDAVAAGLQELQAAGVVVIWRPLHEMNGGWFWWGAQDPATFIAVWRHMFDYLTQTKKLHNLIWAYSPNHGQKPADAYYPGDAYVDLVGLDAYTDHINPDKIIGFERYAGIRKPIGLTEYGPHGASKPPGDYDYRRLLDGIEKNFPQLRHFLVWNEKWNPASNHFAREFYNDPRVLTRETMPPGLAGP